MHTQDLPLTNSSGRSKLAVATLALALAGVVAPASAADFQYRHLVHGLTVPASPNPQEQQPATLVLAAEGYRSWNDGTYAENCKSYRNPVKHAYTGATGDGVYRILIGTTPVDVYCDMTQDGGGWTLVRHLPPTTSTWFPVNDNLIGGQGFGTYLPNPAATTTNGLAFSAIPYSEFRLATGDNARWMRFAKTELQKPYSSWCEYSATIAASNYLATPYVTSWCFRSAKAEDPWITLQGTGGRTSETLYGEGSYGYVWAPGTAPVGGINVFIR